MKAYLELEGKLGPQPQTQSQPCTSTPPQNNNPVTRKAPGTKMNEKKRTTRVPAKRRYKVRVIAQPLPTTLTTSAPVNPIPTPNSSHSYRSTQMPVVKSAAMSAPVTLYKLSQGTFKAIPYPTGKSQVEENPSTSNCNPPQSEATPNVPAFQVRKDTPWPHTMPASTYLFEARADWPILSVPAPTVKSRTNRSTTPRSSNPSCLGFTLNQWIN